MSPKIFVIIPAYNVESFIEECINSVLNQPYKNIEIVIINDGSTDKTKVICDSLATKHKRINTIHQTNAGVSVARNTGLNYIFQNNLHCDYVIFLDSDDFWFDNALNDNIVSSFDNFDIIGMSTYLTNFKGTRFNVDNIAYERQITNPERGIRDWPAGTFCSYFIKASNIKKYNLLFDKNLKYNEDVIFIKKVFMCSQNVKFYPIPLYAYRMNSFSATHTSKITLKNATDLAKGWYDSKSFFDNFEDLSNDLKLDWKRSCEILTGVRLLENAMILAMNGFSSTQIKETIFSSSISHCYDQLSYKELCDWQRKPYKLLNNNIKLFTLYYRLYGFLTRFIQRIINTRAFFNFVNTKKYPFLKNDIIK